MTTHLNLLRGIFFIIITTVSHFPGFSQCAGGSPASTLTYDTIVLGNGNSNNSFSFPKFDPALGTLMSADLQSVVGLTYSYDLENQTSLNQVFKTKIIRTDDIFSSALDPSSVSALNQTPYASYIILSHQQLHYGPANMHYTVSNSVSDGRLVNFMGAGNVDFDYETGTSASVQGPLPWQLNFTSVVDTTHFSVTYRYCSASVLSADLLFFSATALKDKVSLNWRQAVTASNRVYTLQVSTDGQIFTEVASIKENASGAYAYTYLTSSVKRLYFRIEQRNPSGELKYSNIRIVEPMQTAKPVVKVFPTLYTGGNLTVSFPVKASWQINVYSAEGRKITGSREKDVYSAQLVLPPLLINGFYTVEVINTQTQERQLAKIVIQR